MTSHELPAPPLSNRRVEPTVAELVGQVHRTGLAASDVRILQLIADGHRYSEIGRLVHLSASAVGKHARAITERLGGRNLTHAVAIAYRCGLLTAAEVA
ncbi:MAG TPA: LuxR C-terminal-related transcriptional regulator [Pseudonocardiaceae bacterium]|nr:LuxR C-terminal-related transcriptional regulator [Pseudonocardiaceae bacterium]